MKKLFLALLLSLSISAYALTLPNITLKPGDTNSAVKTLQQTLNSLGYNITELGKETQFFGQKTREAVKDLQCKYSIVCRGSSFGIVGPKTRKLLTTLPTRGRPIAATTDGLVAYYPFDGNANDAQGSNHGTIMGGASFT